MLRRLIPRRIRKILKDSIGITALQSEIAQLKAELHAWVNQVNEETPHFPDHIQEIRKYNEQLETSIAFLRVRVNRLEQKLHSANAWTMDMELARGKFSRIEANENDLRIFGWILLPDRELDSAYLLVNQKRVAETRIIQNEDGVQHCPWILHARDSGFDFTIPLHVFDTRGMIEICVVGVSGDKEIAKIETWFRKDLYTSLPTPPRHLMLRENNIATPQRHLISGLRCYREFWVTACKHKDPKSIEKVLDWGCGAGRITGFFLKYSDIHWVFGCDIDAEAIKWCCENLNPAKFSVIPLYPPTSYADNEFDLIISFSVLTHLPKDVQLQWLMEMRRILAPGGLFLATVHGEFATQSLFPASRAREMLRDGIHDALPQNLDEVAPTGYYRSVFQTKAYTIEQYSQYFELLEYIERGAMTFQDMVVMRKRNTEKL